jgi:hypothetical protein
MLRREFRQSNFEALATKKAVFFGPFATLVVFKEFHGCLRLANGPNEPRAAGDMIARTVGRVGSIWC